MNPCPASPAFSTAPKMTKIETTPTDTAVRLPQIPPSAITMVPRNDRSGVPELYVAVEAHVENRVVRDPVEVRRFTAQSVPADRDVVAEFDDRLLRFLLPADVDGDGVFDGVDNCALDFNPDQSDGDLDGLGDRERIFQFNTQISYGAVHFGVPEQKLNRAQIACLLVDLRNLGPSHRVRAVGRRF